MEVEGSYSIEADSVAKFTVASTPSTLLSLRSTRDEHEVHGLGFEDAAVFRPPVEIAAHPIVFSGLVAYFWLYNPYA